MATNSGGSALERQLQQLLMEGVQQGIGERRSLEIIGAMLVVRQSVDDAAWAEIATGQPEDIYHRLNIALAEATQDSTALHLPQVTWAEGNWLASLSRLFPQLVSRDDSGTFYEALLENVGGAPAGDHFTPLAIVNLAARLLSPHPPAHIYDPFARGGEFLLASARLVASASQPSLTLAGDVQSEQDAFLATINLRLHALDARIAAAYPFSRGAHAHYVFSNPPFNQRLPDRAIDREWHYGKPPKGNANFGWLQYALENLRPQGTAAIVMANSASSSRNSAELAIRTAMVEDGVVDAVVALPPQLFADTAIPVTLWMMSRRRGDGRILFLDAHSMGTMLTRTRRGLTDDDMDRIVGAFHAWQNRDGYTDEPGFSFVADLEDIREHGYDLVPARYIRPAEQTSLFERLPLPVALSEDVELFQETANAAAHDMRQQLERLSAASLIAESADGWERTTLAEVCDEITAGPSGAVLRSESYVEAGTGVPVVMPKDIGENVLLAAGVAEVSVATAQALARFRLQPGDIVCSRRGSLGRRSLVRDENAGWLFGTGCFRVRAGDQVDPRYLSYHLGHPSVREWLIANSAGAIIPSISTRIFAELPITLPPLDTQRAISDVLGALDARIIANERLNASVAELRDTLLPRLLSGEQQIS